MIPYLDSPQPQVKALPALSPVQLTQTYNDRKGSLRQSHLTHSGPLWNSRQETRGKPGELLEKHYAPLGTGPLMSEEQGGTRTLQMRKPQQGGEGGLLATYLACTVKMHKSLEIVN